MTEATPDTIRLRELAKAATSGPWKLTGQNMKIFWRVWIGGQHLDAPPADAEYISAVAPGVVRSLLDRIEELQAEAFKWHRMAAACEGWDEPSQG